MKFKLDPWQKKFIKTKGDKILCCGRQVGKSEIAGIDAGKWALEHEKKTILMIAPTERQAYALFQKTFAYVLDDNHREVKQGKEKPTKTQFKLKNGTQTWCLPTGLSGLGVRFLTVHRLYGDEASRIPQPVFDAVSPMMATTGGDTIYLSTPFVKDGEFYDCWANHDNAYDSFTRFHQTTENVIKNREICKTWTELQRQKSLAYIERERKKKTELAFAQEYLGKFMEEIRQFFSDDLIRACMTIKPREQIKHPRGTNYAGYDIAGMGGDEIVEVGLNKNDRNHLTQIEQVVKVKQWLTVTVRQFLASDLKHNYSKLGIDDGGIGVGVFHPMLEHPQTKRKIVALNNASRNLDHLGKKKKTILKEDMYTNLLWQMEGSQIDLWKSDKLFHSLRSVQAEAVGNELKLSGKYTHIAEALIRAAWLAKTKHLKLWVR